MQKYHPEICLFQPEIPQNTGNIGRLAAATQCRLHLIKPFGFATDDRQLRRPGLDYWPYLDLEIHDSIEPLLKERSPEEMAFFSARATSSYWDMTWDFSPSFSQPFSQSFSGSTSKAPKYSRHRLRGPLLIFGRETQGLPDFLWDSYQERFFKIPIYHEKVRSLNLANACSIIVYHTLHQIFHQNNS